MTIDEMIEVLEAAKAGKTIQYRNDPNMRWNTVINPMWNFFIYEYRAKPEPLECWVTSYDEYPFGGVYRTHEAASQNMINRAGARVVHMREVEDD